MLGVMNFTASLLILFCVVGCSHFRVKEHSVEKSLRWLNPSLFAGADDLAMLYDAMLSAEVSRHDGGVVQIDSCMDLTSIASGTISERDYARFRLMQANCEAANRYLFAPEYSVSYWSEFDGLQSISGFPSAARPFLGGDTEPSSGSLGDMGVKLIGSGEQSVHVVVDNMNVTYMLAARGDFNQDGVEDFFVRMDWANPDGLGEGVDWIVLTRLSKNQPPMLLWRSL